VSALQEFLYTKPGCFCASLWTGAFAAYGAASMSEALKTGRWPRALYSVVLLGLCFLPLGFY
jgi:hypothetical protein